MSSQSKIENPKSKIPKRLLLCPGPSEVDPQVLRSLIQPPLGHLDPVLLAMMSELQDMLRGVFRTRNRLTLAISGTGTMSRPLPRSTTTCVLSIITRWVAPEK